MHVWYVLVGVFVLFFLLWLFCYCCSVVFFHLAAFSSLIFSGGVCSVSSETFQRIPFLFRLRNSDMLNHSLYPGNSTPLKKPSGSNILHCFFTCALILDVHPCPCSKPNDLLLHWCGWQNGWDEVYAKERNLVWTLRIKITLMVGIAKHEIRVRVEIVVCYCRFLRSFSTCLCLGILLRLFNSELISHWWKWVG